MLFYVSLFVACVISALLVLYLYNVLADAGKAVYKAFLPSKRNNLTSHVGNVRFHSKVNDTPTPWGWKGNDHAGRKPVAKGAEMDGATGLDAFVNKHSNESSSVGWPYREEKNEFAGKSYKVSRRKSPKKNRLQTSGDQPWGW